jgi:hypothetical protein
MFSYKCHVNTNRLKLTSIAKFDCDTFLFVRVRSNAKRPVVMGRRLLLALAMIAAGEQGSTHSLGHSATAATDAMSKGMER